jgi:hypothetical protein
MFVLFEILTAMINKSYILWIIFPYSLLKFSRRFGEKCRILLQNQGINETKSQHEAGRLFRLLFIPESPLPTCYLLLSFLAYS